MAEKTSGENPDHLWDVDNLTATELRLKYPREWNSWRNGKRRAGENWHPAFEDWRDFLREMGPAGENETLDRINNDDPRYGPGLCKWSDKHTQAINRNSTWLKDGEALDVIAARTGSDVRSLRRDMRRANPFGANPLAFQPWPKEKSAWWEQRYKSGPHLNEYRFEYLIRLLARQRSLEEQWAEEHEDDLYSDDPKTRSAAEERGRLLHRLTEVLVRARIDYDRWLPFAERFIRQHPNLGKDGQTRLPPKPDWD